MSNPVQAQPPLPSKLMLGIAFGQGIALLLLSLALANEAWPSQTPVINFPLWTLAIASPAMLLFCLDGKNLSRSLKAVGCFSTVLLFLALYVGWQASPHGQFPIDSLLFAYFLSMLIACFKGLMYCQQWIAKSPMDYEDLFTRSWRNFLVAAFAAGLTLGVRLILVLWAALFSAIGIDFFEELLRKDWVLYPLLTFTFAYGIWIFRRLVKIIDSITKLLEGLIRLLLPIVASVLIIFLSSLAFTTLEPLWETGFGTALLFWLNALTLFFVNAVYQKGQGAPYSPWMQRILSVAIVLLPVISALALYGLYLRIDEYGWTVERCWAAATLALLMFFSTGYAGCVIRWRWMWHRHLGLVNTAMGGVVLAVMVLSNSPMLDFRRISLASQLQRVEAGEVELKEFDYRYARHHLARPGHQAMQSIIAEHETSDPELVRIIQAAEGRRSRDTFDLLWANLSYRPEPFEPPTGLREAARDTVFGDSTDLHENPVLIRVDLDEDGEFEYALLSQHPEDRFFWGKARLFFHDGDAWRSVMLNESGNWPDDIDVGNALREGEIKLSPARFKNLNLGELSFQPLY
ncbi:MAG: DUF4153 domain-containing protein [Gammaproteobacteria bacterium]|nr:DUF4153 domain-containing protein [Gammaproteobacteria bacterium]